MTNPGMKTPGGLLVTAIITVVLLAAAAPLLIALGHALLPLVFVVGVVAIALRLVFFHTRKW